jgi:butyryl-CoA dehydrogenase
VNLELTEEQKLLQKSVREFAEAEVRPLAKELDEKGHVPRELFKKAAELGLTGVALPEAEGGAGFDHVAYTIVVEEISRCCASTGVILSVQNSLYCDPIHRYGSEEQKKKFLGPFARGEKIGCYALTEPQAGSNAAALQTKAVKHGEKYVINGTKAWITNGGAADAAIVYVNTEPAKGEKGITALVVEKGTPGFKVGKEEKKLGINATACSELVFTDCEVPVTNRIGNEGEGYKVALSTLDGGRIGIAAQATGIAQGAFEAALQYAQERLAFGKPISQFQAINSCWRICLQRSMRHGFWSARRLGSRILGRDSVWTRQLQNFLPARWPRALPTRRFKCMGEMVTVESIPWNEIIVMRESRKSMKEPARFSGW